MQPFEQKALDYYGEVVINKHLIHEAGFGARAIPTYVGEWILSEYIEDGQLTDPSRQSIAEFIGKHLPTKAQKDEVKNRLLNMEAVHLLDDYSVSVNLKTGTRQLRIPLLDIHDAFVTAKIVEDNELLLSSGVWGIGELFYVPPDEHGNKGQVWMRDFDPFQVGNIDIDYFITCRQQFTFHEWLDLMTSSTGFNPLILTDRQKNAADDASGSPH
jgi:ATP-dependent Lon protease